MQYLDFEERQKRIREEIERKKAANRGVQSVISVYDLYAKARTNQVPPSSDWLIWDIKGGRGSGKTWAISQWAKSRAFLGDRTLIISPCLGADHLANHYFINDPCTIYNGKTRTLLVGEEQNSVKILSDCNSIDSLRGQRFDAIAFDDVGYTPAESQIFNWLFYNQEVNPNCKKVFVNRPFCELIKPSEQHVLTKMTPKG